MIILIAKIQQKVIKKKNRRNLRYQFKLATIKKKLIKLVSILMAVQLSKQKAQT